MLMQHSVEVWLKGLIAAIVSGGASGVISGLTAMGFAPGVFNLSTTAGFWHLMLMMLANFVFNGFIGMMLYLKQSPVPPEEEAAIPKG